MHRFLQVRSSSWWFSSLMVMVLVGEVFGVQPAAAVDDADGWQTESPREEIRPQFAFHAKAGRSGNGEWVIEHSQRDGLQGCWYRTVPVDGGKYYRFEAFRKTRNVADPRRCAVPRILWQDDRGQAVAYDKTVVDFYRSPGSKSLARPEYPLDAETDSQGWTRVQGSYRAPDSATQARIELHLRWAPGGRIGWSDIDLAKIKSPPDRKVRLATIHFRPSAKSPAGNCRQFAPLIAEAAKQGSDLVVLPETLTFFGTGASYAECAESIPGPSTDYFSELAKKHGLYLVVGLLEKNGPLVHNVAVLIGPEGKIEGKYRKVCLPRGEVEGGITPGKEYPVFKTRFGKVGMMVCYDGFFPEVARELTRNGAEVIAWPVWGCNPLLARARACENHIYLISSTYTDAKSKWIVSGIYDHTGELKDYAKEWGQVVVVEVDLAKPTYWSGIGDFRAEMTRHRPAVRE